MQRLILLITTYWALTIQVYGQGTPAVLRCTFKGSLDIHASHEPGSPIVAKIQCGEAILLLDQRFGSPQVRTQDGKDGFIIGLNIGQWSIEPESPASRPVVPERNSANESGSVSISPSLQPTPPDTHISTVDRRSLPPDNPATTITSDEAKLRGRQIPLEDEERLNSPRRFETFLAPFSISRWGQMNLYGGELELAIKITDRLSLIADVGDYRSIGSTVITGSGFQTSGRVETLTYRFGPKFSIRPNDRLTIFGHAAAGRTRVKATYDFGDGFTLDALSNGLVVSGGGGVDFAIKKWLGLRLVQTEYSHNRIDGAAWHDVRAGSGLVFRIK